MNLCECGKLFPEQCARDCIKAERDALRSQLDEVLLKDRGKTNEINLLTKENRQQNDLLERAMKIMSIVWEKTFINRSTEDFEYAGIAWPKGTVNKAQAIVKEWEGRKRER